MLFRKQSRRENTREQGAIIADRKRELKRAPWALPSAPGGAASRLGRGVALGARGRATGRTPGSGRTHRRPQFHVVLLSPLAHPCRAPTGPCVFLQRLNAVWVGRGRGPQDGGSRDTESDSAGCSPLRTTLPAGRAGKRAEPPSGCSGAQSAGHPVVLHLPGVTRPPHPPGSPRRRLPKARARLLPQPLGHAASSGEQCPRTVAPGGSSEPGEPRPPPFGPRRSPAQGAPGRRVQLHLQLLRNVHLPRGSEKKPVRIPASGDCVIPGAGRR